MLFNPRNAVEQRISQFMRLIHPYLAFITYRFHVEKSREIGKFQIQSVFDAHHPHLGAMMFNLKLILYRNQNRRLLHA